MKSPIRNFAILIAAVACTPFAPISASAQEKETKLMNVAEGIDASKIWDGRKLAPFKALDNPPFEAADKADYLDDTEYVLGVTIKGVSRAYPTRFVWFHHVVNDSIGTTNFAITYCSVCNTGIAYDLKLDGTPLALDFYGLYNGIVALCDRKTEAVFPQALGKFVSGPLSGKELKTIPVLDTTWGAWRKLHPDTVVLSPKTSFEKIYNKHGHLEPRDYKSFPAPYFKPSVSRVDKRLAPFDKTLGLGVTEDGKPQFRAYPFKTLEERGGVVNDELGKTKVAVFYSPDTMSAVALDRNLEGKTYEFETKKSADGKTFIVDKQTSSEWTIEGVAVDGPLKGKSLARLNGHQSQWYGWSATFPETSIYGNSAPPMSLTEIPRRSLSEIERRTENRRRRPSARCPADTNSHHAEFSK